MVSVQDSDGPAAADGPYFDDLRRGQVFGRAPSVTLTEGLAAGHQAILGDRLRLSLDTRLSTSVCGGRIAHPGLVIDVAVGQSTLVTRHVTANLFYRGLRFHHFPRIGDTLVTRTEVVGLRRTGDKPGRPPSGLAALRITSTDQSGRAVLDFHRCAMLPLRPGARPDESDSDAGHADDLSTVGEVDPTPLATPPGWDVRAYRALIPAGAEPCPAPGTVLRSGADVVSSAPELARLTMNIAEVHHDERASGGRRLVYGGHTIGLALAQATRSLPDMLTVLGWASCDHTGPVYEGDLLSSELVVGEATPVDGGGAALALRSLVRAHRPDGDADVLDWSFTVLMPS